MPNHKEALDNLFREKSRIEVPAEVVTVLGEIMKRNDEFRSHNNRRVSLVRTIEWVRETMDYNITEKQIQAIAKQVGRRSWACA